MTEARRYIENKPLVNTLTILLSFLFFSPFAFAEKSLESALSVPGAEGGAGFDDLNFSGRLKKVLVPAGATGQVWLVDPDTQAMISVGALVPNSIYQGGHGEGVTSADEGDGVVFTIDRTAKIVNAWDPVKNKAISSAPLASSPDYVRFVAFTKEVWVTEPDKARIEIFDFSDQQLKHSGFIEISGGPEALTIDQKRQRAYTHLWKGSTVAVDLKDRGIVEQWPNGCISSHGIAFDESLGFLFVGCTEGKFVVLDVAHQGRILGSLDTGWPGVDVIGYNPKLFHAYLAASQSAKLSIIEVSSAGSPELLGVKNITKGSHCVTADDRDGIWVCDPNGGKILYFKDDF